MYYELPANLCCMVIFPSFAGEVIGAGVMGVMILRSSRSNATESHTNWAYISYTFPEVMEEYVKSLLQFLSEIGQFNGEKLSS